jgi:hypothetical protein
MDPTSSWKDSMEHITSYVWGVNVLQVNILISESIPASAALYSPVTYAAREPTATASVSGTSPAIPACLVRTLSPTAFVAFPRHPARLSVTAQNVIPTISSIHQHPVVRLAAILWTLVLIAATAPTARCASTAVWAMMWLPIVANYALIWSWVALHALKTPALPVGMIFISKMEPAIAYQAVLVLYSFRMEVNFA